MPFFFGDPSSSVEKNGCTDDGQKDPGEPVIASQAPSFYAGLWTSALGSWLSGSSASSDISLFGTGHDGVRPLFSGCRRDLQLARLLVVPIAVNPLRGCSHGEPAVDANSYEIARMPHSRS